MKKRSFVHQQDSRQPTVLEFVLSELPFMTYAYGSRAYAIKSTETIDMVMSFGFQLMLHSVRELQVNYNVKHSLNSQTFPVAQYGFTRNLLAIRLNAKYTPVAAFP